MRNVLRAPRGTACHSCRRMKLRCDSANQFPAPCTRCANMKRPCSLAAPTPGSHNSGNSEDQSRRIAQLEEAIRELHPSPHTGDAELSGVPSSVSMKRKEESLSSAAQLADGLGLVMPLRNLGGIEISPGKHFDLIDRFFTEFHPQLPFFPNKTSLVRDCVNCPLLYWAVVAVGSRTSPDLQSIRHRLVWPVRRLAAESVLQPRPLAVIQALLLLCLWPMPFAALIDDPSWSFSGIANHKALLLGLHRPFDALLRQAKGDTELAQAMQLTWTTCCIVTQMLSDRFGIPNQLPMDWHITVIPPASPILAAIAEVVHKDSVISSLLDHHKPGFVDIGPSCLPVLKACEAWMEDLDARHLRHQSLLLERLLCCLKLRLYSYGVGATSSMDASNAGHESALHMASYVSKAYNVAMHVLETALEDKTATTTTSTHADQQGNDASAPCALWTFIDHQSVLMAVLTLLHLVRSHRSLSEAGNVSAAIQRVQSMLQACSIVKGDHFYRVCEVISYHLESAQGGRSVPEMRAEEQPPTAAEDDVAPTIGTGMGVGLAHDMLKDAKRRYRRRRRFPEQFPDVDAGTAEAEAMSVAESTEYWPEFPLAQFLAPEFDLGLWPQWGGGAGMEMAVPMTQFPGNMS